MTQPGMQLCSLEGELLTFLLQLKLQPALANVLVESATLLLNEHRSLVDAIALTEPMFTVLHFVVPVKSVIGTINNLEEHKLS